MDLSVLPINCRLKSIFSFVFVDLSSFIKRSDAIPCSVRYSYIASASLIFSPSPCPPESTALVEGFSFRYCKALLVRSRRAKVIFVPSTWAPSTIMYSKSDCVCIICRSSVCISFRFRTDKDHCGQSSAVLQLCRISSAPYTALYVFLL